MLPNEPALRRWLARLAPDVDPDDVVQETYAKIARDFASVQSGRAYMFTVARNVVVESLRRKRIVRIVAIADLDALPVSDPADVQEQGLIGREELALLQAAIADLPEKRRQVLMLRKIDGLSQREVAQRLGLSESTVEKHVAAGIRGCAAWFARLRPSGAETASVRKDGRQKDDSL